jgi:hypothetical protein
MDKLIAALAPVFAAGFAVQQFLEIPGTLIDIYGGAQAQKYKKVILGVIGAVIGFVLAYYLDDLRVLKILIDSMKNATGLKAGLDIFVTGLIISAGTEGVNSILKFLKYSKEDKKNEAAAGQPSNNAPEAPTARAATTPVPTADALSSMNLK